MTAARVRHHVGTAVRELAFVRVADGWSIARDVVHELSWWCGRTHGWVSPPCRAVVYATLSAALTFARQAGWERRP